MKVNSSKNQNKNILLILNENKSPNLSKQNMTKTRNDAKHGFFNFNLNKILEKITNQEQSLKHLIIPN